jgi:beta-galactosidase
VYCYTSYPSAELFVNGKSQGRRTKDPSSRLDRYRLRWNDVVYQPGELRVVAYDANGKVSGERVVRTAGKPSALAVSADRVALAAPSSDDTPDLAFVTVDVVDEDGNLCPDADCRLRFDTEGSVAFRAVCNGDQTSIERFSKPTMKAFGGRLVVLVEALCSGMGTLHVTSDGLKSATAKFMVK